jgi:WD40 repeat protein
MVKLPGSLLVSAAAWERETQRLIYMQADYAGGELSSSSAALFRQALGGTAQKIAWSPVFSVVLDLLPPNRVVFGGRSSRQNLKEIPIAPGLTNDERFLTHGSSTDRQPTYARDGQAVIFSSNRAGNLDLWSLSWSLSRRTGSLKRLTDDPHDDWDPALSPDGRYLLWSSNRTGQFEIWMVNADGMNPRQVTHGGLDCENPCMTPDGNWIVYIVIAKQKVGIWKIRPDGTDAAQLTASNRGIPEISPDGKYIAYFFSSTTERALRVISLESGKPIPFEIVIPIHKQTDAAIGRLRWMPDGRAIAFLGQDERGVNGVYVQDFVPGKDTSANRRPLGGFDLENSAESFAISPDGKWLTVAAWEQLFRIMATGPVPSLKSP